MKKVLVLSALSAALLLAGCNNKEATAAKPTTTITEQSPDTTKAGYAIGYDMGKNLKDMADDMDLDAFYQGMKDAYEGKDPALTEEQATKVVTDYQKRKQEEFVKKMEEKAAKNKTDGAAWLAENAKKEGVKTTESGLQYKVIKEGTGASPKASDTVVVHYEGKLIDGTVFDSSYERDMPAQFPLEGVIAGWTEGLQLMKKGGTYELYVPSDLAYGETGNTGIEPNSVLIFKIELLDDAAAAAAMEKAKAAQEAQMAEMMKQMQQAQGQAGAETNAAPQGSATTAPATTSGQ